MSTAAWEPALVAIYRLPTERLANPGTPPIVGASLTARTIACATASAPATPNVSTSADSFPKKTPSTLYPHNILVPHQKLYPPPQPHPAARLGQLNLFDP